jgi:predicted DCC family thiol-disulfide oxidoreductase YuxK
MHNAEALSVMWFDYVCQQCKDTVQGHQQQVQQHEFTPDAQQTQNAASSGSSCHSIDAVLDVSMAV